MAWSFDEVNDYVTVGDDPVLSLPDGDHAVGGWINFADNSGSFFQYFYSHGTYLAANSYTLLIGEAGSGFSGNQIVRGVDAEGDWAGGTSFLGITAGTWHHFLSQRVGTSWLRYRDGVLVHTSDGTNVGAVDPAGSLYLGAREDLDADRYFGGAMAEWAKWDRSLTAGEIGSLVAGFSPMFLNPTWYIPMDRDYREVINNLPVTNNGSTISAHPPILNPAGSEVIL